MKKRHPAKRRRSSKTSLNYVGFIWVAFILLLLVFAGKAAYNNFKDVLGESVFLAQNEPPPGGGGGSQPPPQEQQAQPQPPPQENNQQSQPQNQQPPQSQPQEQSQPPPQQNQPQQQTNQQPQQSSQQQQPQNNSLQNNQQNQQYQPSQNQFQNNYQQTGQNTQNSGFQPPSQQSNNPQTNTNQQPPLNNPNGNAIPTQFQQQHQQLQQQWRQEATQNGFQIKGEVPLQFQQQLQGSNSGQNNSQSNDTRGEKGENPQGGRQVNPFQALPSIKDFPTIEGRFEVRSANNQANVNLNDPNTHIVLSNTNSNFSLTARNADGKEVQIDKEAFEKINTAIKLETGSELRRLNDSFMIKRGNVEAQTTLPISFNVATKTFTAQTSSGTKELAFLPDQAVEKLMQNNVISKLETDNRATPGDQNGETGNSAIKLTEYQNQPVFEVRGIAQKRLLGLIPVSIPKTTLVSAETGDLVKTDTTGFGGVLNLISF